MSFDSSPMSARQYTPDSEPHAVLTPSRKVKALLAQFSDSGSEDNVGPVPRRGSDTVPQETSEASKNDHQEDDDDEDEVFPRSRLTARLFGGKTGHRLNTPQGEKTARLTEQSTSQPGQQSEIGPENISGSLDSSDDEIVGATPARKRKLGPRDDTSAASVSRVEERLRSESPLFFPSPNATRDSASPQSMHRHASIPDSPVQTAGNGRSKFLALVDKHRKERIAREAAEIAKRAAGMKDSGSHPRRARGSSPADDSSEGNASADDAAIKRIQKQARPTRKASKKALEEMNRETQRMNRNMQLAHQATTKKKITKESLLARFNFSVGSLPGNELSSRTRNSTASSSAAASDAESVARHYTTPPTSPMREVAHEAKISGVKDVTHLLATGQVTTEMHGALAFDAEVPKYDETLDASTMTIGMREWARYFKSDLTVKSPKSDKSASPLAQPVHASEVIPFIPKLVPTKISLIRATLTRSTRSESDDDEIEIVRDQGLKRKYAIFEGLTRKKAKEMPSHLALRTLAHLADGDNQKRSVNAAELEVDLRRKARMQALEGRRQRLDELRAKGIIVQTAEERERDQLEVEDLVERARQEAVEIQKREKQLAKKDGTYIKDGLDDEEDESEDSDFGENEDSQASESDEENEEDEEMVESGKEQTSDPSLLAEKVTDGVPEDEHVAEHNEEQTNESEPEEAAIQQSHPRLARHTRIVSDDEDDESGPNLILPTPELPNVAKTPQIIPLSVRKMIPGLQMSDDLPMGLSQAFAATMAESPSQLQSQEQDSLDLTMDLPSPVFAPAPTLQRFDSVDLISDSQPSASQTQPLNVELVSQSQVVPDSPRGLGIHGGTQYTPSQRHIPFDLTQDNGYIFSPFTGNRFADTPILDAPNSTVETVILPAGVEQSPILQRRGRLQRGRVQSSEEDDTEHTQLRTAYQVMKQAAKVSVEQQAFDKKKSNARNIVDDAAEESEDEYAGLGGASDDSGDDEENEDDRRMIDQDTEVGKGDEAKLAGLFADRERERDEKEVSKLLKDITTGALRRKRGVGDDLDLSDEEDAAARRREAKRREFARMRRELLKDEAVGKIAEDKRKEAFLRSIEDYDEAEADNDIEEDETAPDSESQSQPQTLNKSEESQREVSSALATASDSQINRLASAIGRRNPKSNRKPATLAEIRDSVSFLIEEPESQSAMVDLGFSDSEEEPEAYVDLDRHFREAEADENRLDEETDDLGDFVVDDDLATGQYSADGLFKKPGLPRQERAPFTERRTKHTDVVDRLSLLRQASSASSTASTGSTSTKMAFLSSKTGSNLTGVPSLLRRATTNSSLGSMSGRDNVSATGVVTSKTERGNAGEEKEFVRKGNGGRRNAVNFQADRKTLREEKMSARAGIKKAGKGKKSHGFLGSLFRGDTWD